MEVKYILANNSLTEIFEFLSETNREGVRKDAPVVFEMLRDLRGTLEGFLGPDGFKN